MDVFVNSENFDENNELEYKPTFNYNDTYFAEKKRIRKLGEQKKKSSKYDPLITTKDGITKHASELTYEEQEIEFIRCAKDPIYFIETYLTIFDQTKGKDGMIVPFKLFEMQKKLIRAYQENRFVIANKYRQAGVSTTTCAYIAWYVIFNNDRQVAIVADKLETARDELMNDVVNFIENCPSWLRPKTGRDTKENLKDTQKLKIYDNGSRLGAFSSKGLRGMTPTLIFWDEVAWTEKSDRFWTSALPTLQTGGRAILVSTPSGLDPVFYKTFINAKNKENDFNAIELWWFNDPRYNKDLVWIKNKGKENEIILKDENWSDEKRIKMMEDGWYATSPWLEEQISNANGDMRKIAQELLCSFLGSGDNFIAEEFLKNIEENQVKPPIRQEGLDGNMWIWEDPLPTEDYIMGLDVSAGHSDDYSTINILKVNEYIENKIITKNDKEKKIKIKKFKVTQVAEFYGKILPQTLGELAYQYGKRYNNAYCIVDITGGYGAQTIEKLFELGYTNIHYSDIAHKPSRDRLNGYIKKSKKVLSDGTISTVDLIPGFFISANRGSVLLEMQRAINMGDVHINSFRLLNELKTFVTVAGNRVADHKRSFHDDSIISLAIALYVLNYENINIKSSAEKDKKILDAIINVNDIKTYEKKVKNINTPIIPPDGQSTLSLYLNYQWLFKGLKK